MACFIDGMLFEDRCRGGVQLPASYKVVTSSSFVTGPKKFDTKDFIWTLYRPSCEMEM